MKEQKITSKLGQKKTKLQYFLIFLNKIKEKIKNFCLNVFLFLLNRCYLMRQIRKNNFKKMFTKYFLVKLTKNTKN